MAHWTQSDMAELCQIVIELCDLTERVVQDRGRGHELTAKSIKSRASALHNKTLGERSWTDLLADDR